MRPTNVSLIVTALLIIGFGLWTRLPDAPPPPANVLIIVVDTLRADAGYLWQ